MIPAARRNPGRRRPALPGAATAAGRLDGLGALHALSSAEAFGAGTGTVPGQGNYAMSLPA